MTDLRYMNDLSELQYAENLARDLIRREQESASPSVPATLLDRLGQTLSIRGESGYVTDYFATSFCEEGNLLSQWRGYAGADGAFALGVEFPHVLTHLNRSCRVRRVIYAVDQQEDWDTNRDQSVR